MWLNFERTFEYNDNGNHFNEFYRTFPARLEDIRIGCDQLSYLHVYENEIYRIARQFWLFYKLKQISLNLQIIPLSIRGTYISIYSEDQRSPENQLKEPKKY